MRAALRLFMMSIPLGTLGLAIFLVFLATGGCSTTGKSYLPIDSQLRPWQPPEDLASAPAATTAPASTPSGAAEKKGKK